MATNGNAIHQEQYPSSPAPAENPSTSNNNLSKDEVGWYFVEQYYTTLSKSPDKLHLFYGKRSQFVYGREAEIANVSVGRTDIQTRIKELDFHDCKVRISNVDSQASFDNIVIQVIGEFSNKSEEPKKFVQTFVLAQQPSGYFVLNDILRYIDEESDDDAADTSAPEATPAVVQDAPKAAETEAEPEAEPEAPKSAEVVPEEAATQLDAVVIDKKLEEVGTASKETPSASSVATPGAPAPAPAPAAATSPAPPVTAPETGAKPAEAEAAPEPEKAAMQVAEEESKKSEAPKEPAPTPVTKPVAPPAEPEKPKEPPKPMTWASRAAAAAGPVRPVVPLPKTATPPAQPRPAAPAQQPGTPVHPAEGTTTHAHKDSANEWRTAGADSKRQNRPQSVSQPPEKEVTLGYVKFVTEKVKDDDLRAALSSFGELVYFDINRSKNCAFVEYATTAGYQAAVAASPLAVDGENIVVEPRRPKAGAYGGSNYNPNRGSISGRGRGGFEGGRSGNQGGGRGGYNNRGRGSGAPRGRGASQATNA